MLQSEIVTQVQRRFGDAVGIYCTAADIMAWLNEGQLVVARESNYFSVTGAAVTVSTYLVSGLVVPSNIFIKRIMFGTTPLQERDYNLILAAEGGSLATGRPAYWYMITQGQDDSDPGITRQTKIGVWPTPDTAQTDTFVVTYGVTPTPLTTVSSPIDAPETFHPALMNFCLMRAHERNKDWQAMKLAQDAFQQDLAQRAFEGQQGSEDWPSILDVMGY